MEKNEEHINAALLHVLSQVGAIEKQRKNTAQGYVFRGIDDVLTALHDLFVEAKMLVTPRVVQATQDVYDRFDKNKPELKTGQSIYRVLHVEYIARSLVDGSSVVIGPVIGEGMDTGDKAATKAMSVAMKMAMLQAFCIPTEESKDPEADDDTDKHVYRKTDTPAPSKPVVPPAPKLLDDQRAHLLLTLKNLPSCDAATFRTAITSQKLAEEMSATPEHKTAFDTWVKYVTGLDQEAFTKLATMLCLAAKKGTSNG